MIENLDPRQPEQGGIPPSAPPISGAEYVTRALGLRLDVFMGEDGCFTPQHLGGFLGARLLTLVSRFDAGLPSDRELAKLRDRIPDDVRAAFAIPDDSTQDPVADIMSPSANDIVVFAAQKKPWSGRSRASAEKIPGSTRSRKYKLREGRVLGGRGPGRYGKKKRF